MALTILLADAANPGRPPPGEWLKAALPLIGALLVAALILYLLDRWRKRAAAPRDECAPSDQLSDFRSLYERGEMSREEFESIRALLTRQLRQELNVPAPPHPASPSAVGQPPPVETNVQQSPPQLQNPPPPQEPPP